MYLMELLKVVILKDIIHELVSRVSHVVGIAKECITLD